MQLILAPLSLLSIETASWVRNLSNLLSFGDLIYLTPVHELRQFSFALFFQALLTCLPGRRFSQEAKKRHFWATHNFCILVQWFCPISLANRLCKSCKREDTWKYKFVRVKGNGLTCGWGELLKKPLPACALRVIAHPNSPSRTPATQLQGRLQRLTGYKIT